MKKAHQIFSAIEMLADVSGQRTGEFRVREFPLEYSPDAPVDSPARGLSREEKIVYGHPDGREGYAWVEVKQ